MSAASEGRRPPAYLSGNIADLIDPRFVVIDYRRMMQPYHSLEKSEGGVRFQTRIELDIPLRLWLRAIALYQAPFSGRFEWPEGLSNQEKEAFNNREELLGLVGGASKPTLDAILDGYYWSAFGMVRSLLEACRRVGYVRLRPSESLPFFQAPTESPIDPDGKPRRNRARPIPFDVIKEAYADAPPEDQKIFGLINAGITHMHAGSHPSAEGMLQVSLHEGRRVFGPTYLRYWAAFGLKWGILANIVLLGEVHLLQPQEVQWLDEYSALKVGYRNWQRAYNEEFVDNDETNS